MTTLADVAVTVHADMRRVRPEVMSGADAAGKAGGTALGTGLTRGVDGKLKEAHGRFVADSGTAGDKAGKAFAGKFGSNSESLIGRSFKKIAGIAGPLLIPIGIGAAVKAIGTIGMAYEDNLNIFQTLTKASGAQMDQVAAKARELGADVKLPGVSAAGAAAAMTELAKSGFTVAQSMEAARATLQWARAAGIEEAKAAEITSNAINAFGLKAKDTSFVVDELAAAANSSSVEIGDVSLAFKMAAAVFSGFQGPAVGSKEAITELNTAIAVLGNNGIKGSDAGTSLKQMLLQLTAPSTQAKDIMAELAANAFDANISLEQQNAIMHGSKSQREDMLKQLYKTNPQLKQMGDIAFDGAGKMRPLRDIIGLVSAGTKNMTQEERTYAITQIFGADAARSVIALMKGGIGVYDKQRQAVLQVGAAADVAAAKNKGLKGAIDNVRSQLENAAISMYNAIRGPLTKALNGIAATLPGVFAEIGRVFGALGNHSGLIRDIAVAVLSMVAAWKAYALVMLVATKVTKAWAVIQGAVAFIQLASGVRSFAAAWALLDAAMVANPIGIVVVALAALVAGIVIAYRHSATFRAIVQGAWSGIKAAVSATVSWIMGTAWPAIKAAWNGIAAAATWLWHNVLHPVWQGIAAVIGTAIAGARGAIQGLMAFWQNVVAPVALWLWHHVFEPAFHAIAWAVKAAMAVAQLGIAIWTTFIKAVLVPIVLWLWHNIIEPAWRGIATTVRGTVLGIRNILSAIVSFFRTFVAPAFMWLWTNVVAPVFGGISKVVSSVWEHGIKPVFVAIGNYVRVTLAGAFRTGVGAITTAWNLVKAAAKAPITFVVNHVINPLIGGFNKVAKIFGTSQIPTIGGFEEGGKIPGPPSSRDNLLATLVGAGGRALAPLKVATGEFIVNARDTARALPILRWINAGMKGGPAEAARRIGRPLTDMPGDGSEGWAFAKGGLVGFLSDVWGAIANPAKLIAKPLESMLSGIPGSGLIKGLLAGMGHKLIGGLTHWLSGATSGAGGTALGGSVGAAASFVRAQAGKPYVWASAGPGGYDCSGIVSAAWNVLHGKNPYSHTFSTEGLPGHFFREGSRTGVLLAGWSHPGQSPASSSTGHMAGQIAGMPFESRGSRGVIVGPAARSVGEFAHIGSAYARGGLAQLAKIATADSGRVTLERGWNLIGNGTGGRERLSTEAGGIHFHFHGAVASKRAAKDMVLGAYNELVQEKKIRP